MLPNGTLTTPIQSFNLNLGILLQKYIFWLAELQRNVDTLLYRQSGRRSDIKRNSNVVACTTKLPLSISHGYKTLDRSQHTETRNFNDKKKLGAGKVVPIKKLSEQYNEWSWTCQSTIGTQRTNAHWILHPSKGLTLTVGSLLQPSGSLWREQTRRDGSGHRFAVSRFYRLWTRGLYPRILKAKLEWLLSKNYNDSLTDYATGNFTPKRVLPSTEKWTWQMRAWSFQWRNQRSAT